jgi:protein-tyrosine phosphatase
MRNFRDVGETINRLAARKVLRAGMLYRSGAIKDATEALPAAGTIINLRRQSDPKLGSAAMVQVAPAGPMNNYLVREPVFVDWIQRFYAAIAGCIEWPVLVHCESGKDRTGVALALLLKHTGVDDDLVLREYLEGDYGERYPDSLRSVLREADILSPLAMSADQAESIRRAILGSAPAR